MATRSATSFYMLCVLFFVTAATLTVPALANSSSPPSTLVIYSHSNSVPPDQTLIAVATPSGNLSTLEFGTILVEGDLLREIEAADSPLVGSIAGPIAVEKDLSLYASNTYVLNTTSFAGTISAQGVADSQGEGELAITGGTYDFRFARGYVDSTLVTRQDPRNIVYKLVFTISMTENFRKIMHFITDIEEMQDEA